MFKVHHSILMLISISVDAQAGRAIQKILKASKIHFPDVYYFIGIHIITRERSRTFLK